MAIVSSIHPQPVDDVLDLVASHEHVVTIEAHVRSGGVGSLIAEILADHGSGCRLLRLGVDKPFGHRGGSEGYLNQLHGLSAPTIATRIAAFVGGRIDL